MNIFAGLVGTAIFYKQNQLWQLATFTHDPNMVPISLKYIKEQMNVSESDVCTREIEDDDAVISKCIEELNKEEECL